MLGINEIKRTPGFGEADGFYFAVQIDSLERNDFFTQPFGRSIGDMKKAQTWAETAKTGYVDAKGKNTMPAVKKWIKDNKPTEFYARWKKDKLGEYSDDSVEISYKQ